MHRILSKEEITQYHNDGVIFVGQAVKAEWVDRMLAVVEFQLNHPSEWANDANPGQATNRLFTDRYQWRQNAEIRAYLFESGVAGLAGQAMQSNQVRFYFDHLLVKEPSTDAPTPWHQDVPYWPFMGKQICSVWLALTDISIEQSAMEFVRGSHQEGKYYRPELFADRENHPGSWAKAGAGEKVPDIEAHREDFDIIGWDMKAGDAVLFSAWTLHWAPGNRSQTQRRAAISTRWLGDDVTWFPHEGADPTVTQKDVSIQTGELAHDDKVFPLVWQR